MNCKESKHSDEITRRWIVTFVIGFLFCLTYWLYLWEYSETLIIYDGIGFDRFGRHIHDHGWRSYFEVGPSLEPFYLLIISLSIALSGTLGVDYLVVQSLIQVIFIFIGQSSLFYLLRRLAVKNYITFFVVLYIGISPALVTATFSLYSEIVAIGLLPLSVVLFSRAWVLLYSQRWGPFIMASIGGGITIFVVAITKAPYEYVAYLIVVPFFFLALRLWRQKTTVLATKSLIAGLLILILSGGGVQIIKFVNFQLNGNYVLRCCGEAVLFATTYRRTENINDNLYFKRIGYQTDTNMLWPQVAYVIGGGLCYRYFSKEECDYNTHQAIDVYGFEVLPEKLAAIVPDQRRSKAISLSIDNILSNPGQYFTFTILETVKMFLWETTKKNFVRWPEWLDQLYSTGYRLVLRGIVSIGTCISVCYLVATMFSRSRRDKGEMRLDEKRAILMFTSITIFSTIGLYSLFFVPIRSAFPLAPLYGVCLAVFLSNLVSKRAQIVDSS